MGCQQTKIVPVQESVARPTDRNKKSFQSEFDDDDPHEALLVPQNILPDELTIHELTNTDNQVKIKPIDPQEFNTSFIQLIIVPIDQQSNHGSQHHFSN